MSILQYTAHCSALSNATHGYPGDAGSAKIWNTECPSWQKRISRWSLLEWGRTGKRAILSETNHDIICVNCAARSALRSLSLRYDSFYISDRLSDFVVVCSTRIILLLSSPLSGPKEIDSLNILVLDVKSPVHVWCSHIDRAAFKDRVRSTELSSGHSMPGDYHQEGSTCDDVHIVTRI